MAKNKKSEQNIKLKTYHIIIIDSSGSMEVVQKETISGLNAQLSSIKKASKDFPDQEQVVCITTFGYKVDTSKDWQMDISNIPEYNENNYHPFGGTALYDAIGMSINKLKSEIAEELSERKANIIITIFTDGEENASLQFKGKDVSDLVKEIQETGQWTVSFMGCGEDVFDVARTMNISSGNTFAYAAGVDGTEKAFTTMASSRYARTAQYDSLAKSGLDASDANTLDFFKHIDIDEPDKDPDKK